ncbi:Hypothetical predicted protein [Scomber scombrus]|uniref:Uncharacterized protein n=1 Tax=Scomber scombrus TaxID=13677 RepID=A0AAV1PJU8_SCOSC
MSRAGGSITLLLASRHGNRPRKRISWLLRSQPKKRTAVHTRQGPSPPGRKQTQKCGHLFAIRIPHLTFEL